MCLWKLVSTRNRINYQEWSEGLIPNFSYSFFWLKRPSIFVFVVHCDFFFILFFYINSHWEVGGVYLLDQSGCRDRLWLLDFSEQNFICEICRNCGLSLICRCCTFWINYIKRKHSYKGLSKGVHILLACSGLCLKASTYFCPSDHSSLNRFQSVSSQCESSSLDFVLMLVKNEVRLYD